MAERYLAAAGLILLWLMLCLHAWRRQHRRLLRERTASATASTQATTDASATVIAYASQTGFAEEIATRTARSLEAAGLPTLIVPLGLIDEALLQRAGRVLFVVSTTGEGDAPDSASAFTSRLMAGTADTDGQILPPMRFPALQYAVLALGDREYAQFCGFGKALDQWLQRQGAQPLFDRIDVNNGEPDALEHWQRQVAHALRAPDLPAWQMPVHDEWLLAERQLLNPGNPQAPCFHLVLRPPGNAMPAWQAGDIAEIRIPQAAPATQIAETAQTAQTTQPTPAAQTTYTAQTSAQNTLREYSIASLPSEQAIHLLIRQQRGPDGSLGLSSGWLTTQLNPGDTVPLRIRTNRNFHAPDPAHGLMLIGNGTGLAGLRAHLKARIEAGLHQNWLLFGERHREHDYYFAQELETWRQRGALQRLDLAFSRDQTQRVYVQHLLRQAADSVRAWVGQGAAIYICGSLNGMAQDVHDALTEILGAAPLQQLMDTGRYRRDVY